MLYAYTEESNITTILHTQERRSETKTEFIKVEN